MKIQSRALTFEAKTCLIRRGGNLGRRLARIRPAEHPFSPIANSSLRAAYGKQRRSLLLEVDLLDASAVAKAVERRHSDWPDRRPVQHRRRLSHGTPGA
jgi:hypothetical protein